MARPRRSVAPALCILMALVPFGTAAEPAGVPPAPEAGPLEAQPTDPPGAGLSGEACTVARDAMANLPLQPWTTCNMGPGSGLDADLLDGLESGQFLRSDRSGTLGGTLTADGLRGAPGGRLIIAGHDGPGSDDGLGLAFLAEEGGFDFRTHAGGAWDSRLFIGDDGHVGIGTTTPGARLEIDGDLRLRSGDRDGFWRAATISGSASSLLDLSPWNYGLSARFQVEGPLNLAFVGTTSHDPFRIRSNGADRIFVAEDGNVGVGTNAPAERLEVAGNMRISGAGHGVLFPDGTLQTTAATAPATLPLEAITVVDEAFDRAALAASQWTVTTTGDGRLDVEEGQVALNTIYPGGPDSVTLTGKRAYSVLDGPLVFKASLAAYQETSRVYGNGQPRGLAAGTDRSNAIEFITSAPNTVGCRTVKDGVATQTDVGLGETVYDTHAYHIVAQAGLVRFYVDGALVCTHTANVPTVPLNMLFSSTDGGFGNVPIYLDRATFEVRR